MIEQREKAISKAIQLLDDIQNSDKGIPALKRTDPSCCWVTAETLDAILDNNRNTYAMILFAREMCEFLVTSQLSSGGWPMMVGSEIESTLATGHAVYALSKARKAFSKDIAFVASLEDTISKGIQWLKATVNSDGCWGCEPHDTSGEGNKTRVISTYFALLGFSECATEHSQLVKTAFKGLQQLKNTDGGYGPCMGGQSTIYHTARVISIFYKFYPLRMREMGDSVSFLKKRIKKFRPEQLDSESYVPSDASGEIRFWGNTPIALINALCDASCKYKNIEKIQDWVLKTQKDDGSWKLGNSNDHVVETWSTVEAIGALIKINEKFTYKENKIHRTKIKIYRTLSISLAILLAIAFIVLGGNSSIAAVRNLILLMPSWLKTLIVSVLLSGFGINILSSFIYDKIIKFFKKDK
ncbi:MAG: terpene cyclase/mutase family protein [Clostridia bacterium]|nr:terpene cyclase/mutase family protein [Clostridia bacterium]